MKIRFLLVTVIGIFMAVCLVGCKSSENIVCNEYKISENSELGCLALSYNGVTFRSYGISDRDIRGEQKGIREDDPDTKIYDVEGYSSDEWVIDCLDVFMSDGDMLWKAVGVTEIPAELEQYKEYDYQ
jgi:hypothetical protein